MVVPEAEDLLAFTERVAPIVFGGFSQGDDTNGSVITRGGGSGVFVAPCYAITARHVVRDSFNTNPARADDLRRRESGYTYFPFWSHLFQPSDIRDSKADAIIWGVTRTWDPMLTDICLLEVAPDGELAKQRMNAMRSFPDWSLLPPPVGALVEMVGFPSSDVELNDGSFRGSFKLTVQRAWVREIFEVRRDRGMYSFPCFSVDQSTDHGFSGGPVFHEGRLCGLVSGGSVTNETYVASLWPLCLMEIEYPNLGLLNRKERLADWFESRRLPSIDWQLVRNRAGVARDDQDRPYAFLRPPLT